MANSSDYRLGAIWIVSFAPSVGTEIQKTRPALIISGSPFNAKRSKVTVLPFTSAPKNVEESRLAPAVVFVRASQENGLTVDSLLVCIEPMTFDKARLVKKVGVLEVDLLQSAPEILGRYLSLGT
jgi:mRNA interferase MazF